MILPSSTYIVQNKMSYHARIYMGFCKNLSEHKLHILKPICGTHNFEVYRNVIQSYQNLIHASPSNKAIVIGQRIHKTQIITFLQNEKSFLLQNYFTKPQKLSETVSLTLFLERGTLVIQPGKQHATIINIRVYGHEPLWHS